MCQSRPLQTSTFASDPMPRRSLVKRLLRLAMFLALATTAVSCTDSTGPGDSLSGTYTLSTINGVTPPVLVYQDASVRSEVVAAQIVLDAAGNYQGTTRYRDTYTGQQP